MPDVFVTILMLSIVALIFYLIGKLISTFSPQGVKHRKIKEYRFGYFKVAVQKIFREYGQFKQITSEEYASAFEIPIKNQIEKIGCFNIRASFNHLEIIDSYYITVKAKIDNYASSEYSLRTKYLTQEFCEIEMDKMKKKITESENFRRAYKNNL